VVKPAQRYIKALGGAVTVDGHARELKFFIRVDNTNGGGGGGGDADDDDGSISGSSSSHGGVRSLPEERVFIHPGSANFSSPTYSVPFLVYNEIVRSSKNFVRDCTEASPYALLLAAREIGVVHGDGGGGGSSTLVLDGWARFSAVGRIAALVTALKERIDGLLDDAISGGNGEDEEWESGGRRLAECPEAKVLVALISTEGMS